MYYPNYLNFLKNEYYIIQKYFRIGSIEYEIKILKEKKKIFEHLLPQKKFLTYK